MKVLYRLEVQVSQHNQTRVWRSVYGAKVKFDRNKAIAKASKIRRSLEEGCGRIRIRPAY
jgi:hypothetical protein